MSGPRHSRIIACAGAGKTTELTERIVGLLVDDDAPPDSILAFSFTEKAATELRNRVERRWNERRADGAPPNGGAAPLPPTSRGLFIGTIHSWCRTMLAGQGGRFELFEPLSEEREWSLLLRVARRLGIVELYADTFAEEGRKVASAVAAEAFQRSLEVVHNERIAREELRRAAPGFAEVVARYEALLDGMQLLSFGSMIDRCVDALEDPGSRLAGVAGGRLRHVFVDEFQDLNRAQGALLEALARLGASVHVVADDDQAIYQWRGGDVELFVRFPETFARLGATSEKTLGKNFRSLPHIVDAARGFAATIPGRIEKPIRSHRRYEELEGTLPEEHRKIEIAMTSTPEDEAAWIARRVRGLVSSGVPLGDIAILYRSVRTAGGPVAEALRREGLDAEVVGKLPLLDRPAMSLLADVFILWAGGSWYPLRGQGERRVTRDTIEAHLIQEFERVPAEAARLAAEVDALGQRLRRDGVPDLVRVFDALVARLGLLPENESHPRRERSLGQLSRLLTEFENAQRRALPADFYRDPPVAAAEESAEDALLGEDEESPEGAKPRDVTFDLQPGEVLFLRLRAFLQQYASRAAEERAEGAEPAGDAVTILTIHQAKGLEWPVVFLPSLVKGRFPSSRCGEARAWYLPDALFPRARYEGREADEARLFYVAMTRARDQLILSAFARYDSGRGAQPSPFLETLLTQETTSELFGSGPLLTPAAARDGAEPEPVETDFGKLATYDRCAFEYWLRHECGFQPPMTPALGFGRVVHHVLAELGRRSVDGPAPTRRAAEEILADSFYLPFAGRKDRSTFFESARRRIGDYVDRFGPELVRSLAVERDFDVPLEGGRVRGRVDLVLRAEGGGPKDVEIVDFKTAAERPPPEIHHNQLRLYAAALRRLGYNPVGLYVHALNPEIEPQRQRIEQDPESAHRFRNRLGDWLGGIRDGRFEPCPDRAPCPTCDFRVFCPWGAG